MEKKDSIRKKERRKVVEGKHMEAKWDGKRKEENIRKQWRKE